ncbi:hypothetical protein SAMN05660199_01844 [Klenkia soli]|uniref:Magnesium transporter NIPA n=1 Tax=Klenkia soli TaxID=1052260 RepID=A0A1H0J298_9ACTN|nr:hypothetical protein SAMN05660199_01844 [Klenkia soli]
MILGVVALAVAVLCYGVAGSRLSAGAQEAGPVLRSASWWTGTALQGGGFLLAFVARRDLPLLVVQSAVVAALAVTAVLQQVAGVRRFSRIDALALVGTVAGLALLGAATVPGPAGGRESTVLVWSAGLAVVTAAGLLLPPRAWLLGVLAGVGFSVAAVGARTVVSRLPADWWRFWDLPALVWVVGAVTAAGLLLGQAHLTRGLAAAPAVPVLATMYVTSTVVPAALGHWLLDERMRAGWGPVAVVGCGLALAGALQLLRGERTDGRLSPAGGGPRT